MDKIVKNIFSSKREEAQEKKLIQRASNANRDKLDHLVKRAGRILFKCSSVFPFDFFPDTICVDENKVDIVYRNFFYSEETISILIKNLHFVIADCSIFFCTLQIDVKGFEQDPLPVKYLWKKDALQARRIITGLIACENEGIDLSQFDLPELKEKVIKIGIARER